MLHLGGRPLHHAVLMMIPEAWEKNHNLPAPVRDYYRFFATWHTKPVVDLASHLPPPTETRLSRMAQHAQVFPDRASLDHFSQMGVCHVMVHAHLYNPAVLTLLKKKLAAYPRQIQLAREEGGFFIVEPERSSRHDHWRSPYPCATWTIPGRRTAASARPWPAIPAKGCG